MGNPQRHKNVALDESEHVLTKEYFILNTKCFLQVLVTFLITIHYFGPVSTLFSAAALNLEK